MGKNTLGKGEGASANQTNFPYEGLDVERQVAGKPITPVDPASFLASPASVVERLATPPMDALKARVQGNLGKSQEGKGWLGKLKAALQNSDRSNGRG